MQFLAFNKGLSALIGSEKTTSELAPRLRVFAKGKQAKFFCHRKGQSVREIEPIRRGSITP